MEKLQTLLKKVEENYHNATKKETVECEIGGVKYDVTLLNRAEKLELFLTKPEGADGNLKSFIQWIKPTLYKSFHLKELAVKAKDNGYIKNYYDIVEMLFECNELLEAAMFLIEKNNLISFPAEETEFQKKQ